MGTARCLPSTTGDCACFGMSTRASRLTPPTTHSSSPSHVPPTQSLLHGRSAPAHTRGSASLVPLLEELLASDGGRPTRALSLEAVPHMNAWSLRRLRWIPRL